MTEYLKKAEVLDYLIKCAEGAQADFDENGGESGIYAECLEDVIQDITSMPAADVEPDNWISVKDSLPSVETEVLAACNRNGFRFVCPVIYEDGTVLTQDSIWNWYELDSYGTYSEENDDYYIPMGWWENRQFTPDDVYNNPVDCAVTHWQPLPALPKDARMDGDKACQ